MISWIEGTNESADNIAFFLRLQEAYLPHSPIPTKRELKERNPEYKITRAIEKIQRSKGMAKYYLNENSKYKPRLEALQMSCASCSTGT